MGGNPPTFRRRREPRVTGPRFRPGSRLSSERVFEDLNPEQRAAAVHGGGPLLIVAGAGTGKTMTLAARVASLLERGVRPERLLLLTFSR
ncbi:MAG TPA: UvrD-helicase domain-containing protein, partial [Actinomycetota bacterium]|nr:UvrD-helicase domain-containing protein [Actinomycetota bacterium]